MKKDGVHILLVEDEESHAELIGRAFRKRASEVHLTTVETLRQARDCMEKSPPNLLIADLVLPDGRGIDLLPKQIEDRRFPAIVMTSHGDEQSAVEAIKAGALDYVVKSGEAFSDMPRTAERVLREWENITKRKQAEEETRRLEEKLQQMQKTESLGLLAGGIAHDFNNLLTGVLGFADLASRELAPAAPAQHHVEEIQKAARRAADLCKQMLAYSGRGHFVVKSFDLGSLIDDMMPLLEVSLPKKLVLERDFAGNIPPIEADVNQIRQVIMNLITNGAEAIGDKSGAVRVSTGLIEATRDYFDDAYLADDLAPGVYVYCEVSDTGCGMDAQTQAKIFDPFFTTKFTGRGLGLAAVLGIVRGHHGALKVSSVLGRGTTIRVLFPASRRPEQTLQAAPQVGEITHGEGTILVVDDEEVAREVAKLMFRDSGFSVLTANDGVEGVEQFRTHQDEIVAVLLDMTMPRMSGREAFDRLREIRPDVKVILISGYEEEDAHNRFESDGLSGFLQKPFVRAELLATLLDVLEAE